MNKFKKIGFIGAGKAGFTLGKYFKERDANVTGYYSRNPQSAEEAAEFTNTVCFESPGQILANSDVLFLTVPDSQIETVWNSLKPFSMSNKLICHCSGALSSSVFDGIEQMKAFGYSVHPLFAFSSKLTSYKEMAQTLFTIEGHDRHLYNLKVFIEQAGNPVHIIAPENKIKYHASAVFFSNHVTALAHIGCKLLYECGFNNKFAEIVLKTLFLNHCGAIAKSGPVKALTGPVERNDLSTVKKHMACLEKNESQLYALLSKALIEISKEKHIDSDYSAMEQLIYKEMEQLL